MHITIQHHGEQFNVDLSSKEGSEAFLSIKGCRIVSGQKGDFVSYPARKTDQGKWWNHVWGSERFNAAVLEKYHATKPAKQAPRKGASADEDIPW
ncbi:hypothetical protein [Hydrogenophaga crocea]|uniref:Uncharacterized protein n=1 Tax=Hydrogenophaga crocea TaxID=2716225 RepID=A0A6G8IEU7_9BURK|nr:hypothetical protein [Hydrogenophaga crocea]QIM51588.1 hypothetical protein G9Q37_05270 [Hydrogenophaga crocea]